MSFCRNTANWLSCLVCFAVCASGISCSGKAALNEVHGKVVQKGQPLSGAKVVFHPAEGGANADWPAAITQSDGTFTVKTGERPGAAVGSYKVSIVCMEAATGKAEGMAMASSEEVDRLKGAFADPAKSKFSVEIKAGTNQLEPFDLQ